MSFHAKCAILLVSCFFALAAHGQDCPTTLTYTPATPVVGQPVTATLTVLSTPPSTATSGFEYLSIISATEPGVPTQQSTTNGILNIDDIPASYSFTFTPYEAGQVTLSASTQWQYNFGLTPICNAFLYTAPVTINILGSLNALNGQYAFLFQGTLPQVKRGSQSVAAAGSFTADGAGNITGGVEDVNSSLGAHVRIPLTGSYSIGAPGQSTIKLHSSLGVQSFKFFVPPTQPSATLANATLISDEGYAVFGTGKLVKQSFNSGPFGQAVVNLSGDLPCSATCVSGAPVYESGLLSFVYGTVAGDIVASGRSVLLPDQPVTGAWDGTDQPTGRFTYSLSQGTYPTIHLAGYMIDDSHFFTVSTDSHASTYLLSGTGAE